MRTYRVFALAALMYLLISPKGVLAQNTQAESDCIKIAPGITDFGTQARGASADRTFEITNKIATPITVTIDSKEGDANHFPVIDPPMPFTIAANTTIPVTVRFSAPAIPQDNWVHATFHFTFSGAGIDTNVCHWLLHVVTGMVEESADVEEKPAQTFSVSPNPVHSVLTIRLSNEHETSIVISDLAGKEVFRTTGTGMTKINVSGLAAGVYLLAVAREVQQIVVE